VTVSEVEPLFAPLAEAILDKGLTLPQVRKALYAVTIMHALKRHGYKQAIVAQFLGVGPSVVSEMVMEGRKPKRPVKVNTKKWEQKHGGTPQQVLGGLEL
jgi:predicted transcriptional regulator